MFAEVLFRPFELLLNRGIGRSAAAQAAARALEGRVLGLTVEGSPLDLRLKVTAERVSVVLPDGAAPDACIAGTPLALGRMMRGDPQAPVREGDVRMTGDTEVAGQFRDLLRLAMPDFERELAHLFGDPIAHELGRMARAVAGWGEAAGDSVARGLSDYLQERSRVLPTEREVREFAQGVDTLANDVARAEARIEQLKKAP